MKNKGTVYAIECDGDIGLHHHLYTFKGAMFALKTCLILNAHAVQEGMQIEDLIGDLITKEYIVIRPIDILMTNEEADELAMETNDDSE